jgi:aryl-alcohol dehydrogenase-like predicted oxidoreductase
MRYRTYGRTGWKVSEIGYGMWGIGGWTGSDDEESLQALGAALARGCNFFDTAWAYGTGRSERLLGEARRRHPHAPMYIATKIPPKNMRWPASGADAIADVYPADHIREYTEKSLENLGAETIDLQQFHVWSDEWAGDESWQRAVADLKESGLIRAFGISVNRREPANVMMALRSGQVDSVQVVYNILDQSAEDELFPYCREHGIAVIARVPFDEGGLTGTLTLDSTWPEGDWRNLYFTTERLKETLERVARLHPLLPDGMDLPELALRFILAHPAVSTVIPGMRRVRHVERNLRVSDGEALPPRLLEALRTHRRDASTVQGA